jgi:hypothetical protein
MAVKKDLELIDFAIGLYEQALKLLEPGSDDFSVLSGCILLTVGLEKLIKSVLYTKNPLMILYRKIEFEDFLSLEKGERFNNQDTISFEHALKRLVKLFPSLTKEAKDIEFILKERNFLMHNFGYIDIAALEKKVQTKVADISELICVECLGENPREIFGQTVWDKMTTIKEAYKKAEILEIEQRIKHLKRLHSQGETLPCDRVDISQDLETETLVCPVCEKNTAEVALDWDVDVDHREEIALNAYPYLSLIKCQCGFAMQDPEEIELLLASRYSGIIHSMMNP